jgi:hypothetical protein
MSSYEKNLYKHVHYLYRIDDLRKLLSQTENAIVQDLILSRINELTKTYNDFNMSIEQLAGE